jgi:signal transduction histidine kinase
MDLKALSPKIIHKGMALVIIPFFFNVIWISMLSESLARTARLAELERTQNVLVEHLNSSTQLFMTAFGGLFSYLATGNPQYKGRAKSAIMQFRTESDYILKNTSLSEPQKACLVSLRQALDHQLADLVDVQSQSITGEQSLAGYFLSKRMETRSLLMEANKRSVEVFNVIEREKVDLEELRRRADRSRAVVNDIVAKGLVANLVLALLLVFLFIKDISQRLTVLVKNAQKLPKRLPFEAPVSGNDELSYLDRAMHKAAEDLQKAFEFRASLMQMMAHDLRSPIAASQVSLELLVDDDGPNLSADGAAHVERVQSTNRTLLAMINDLLTIDALELEKLELEIAAVKVRPLVDEAISTLDAIAKLRRIQLSNMCGEEYIQADGKRIIQVLINFLSNAIKFSGSDTKIQIKTERINGSIVVSVIDQGKGMTETTSQKVFGKFYRAAEERTTDGFGLGLAICKLIVTSHGGTVGVESVLGQGSRFWFSLKETFVPQPK